MKEDDDDDDEEEEEEEEDEDFYYNPAATGSSSLSALPAFLRDEVAFSAAAAPVLVSRLVLGVYGQKQ